MSDLMAVGLALMGLALGWAAATVTGLTFADSVAELDFIASVIRGTAAVAGLGVFVTLAAVVRDLIW